MIDISEVYFQNILVFCKHNKFNITVPSTIDYNSTINLAGEDEHNNRILVRVYFSTKKISDSSLVTQWENEKVKNKYHRVIFILNTDEDKKDKIPSIYEIIKNNEHYDNYPNVIPISVFAYDMVNHVMAPQNVKIVDPDEQYLPYHDPKSIPVISLFDPCVIWNSGQENKLIVCTSPSPSGAGAYDDIRLITSKIYFPIYQAKGKK